MGVNRNIPELPKLDDPNDNTLLEAFHGGKNMRILLGKIKEYIISALNFTSIKLIPQTTTPTTIEGELYFDGVWHTIDYNTGLGATVKVGQMIFDVFYNDTGATIEPFKALHLKSAIDFNSELFPTFELADSSNYEKIQGTIVINCCSVADGALGIAVRSATKIKGGDTLSIPGDAQLYVSDDGTGSLTGIKPEFPSSAISVGGRYNQAAAPDGEIFVNITSNYSDIFHEAWDGSITETFNFTTSSNSTIITGLLQNVNPLLNLTLNFSDGVFTLDTTTTPLTIALAAGTDANEVTNYVYVPKSTKVLTVSTSGWPTLEHCRVARLEVQSALTTQADGGTLGNQNTNDHIKKEGNNGHILHIAEWIRKQYSTFESGTEATFDNTGGNGYISITSGIANQLHEQSLASFSMSGGDAIRVWNDSTGNRPKITNLTSITTYSDGTSWSNAWGKIVVWRVANKGGQYAPVMLNLPTGGYNSETSALDDLDRKADYAIPNNFKSKAILIGSFAFRISGGTITYATGYQDLRGQLPISVAGGGSGSSGVTTFLGLADTPSSYTGLNSYVVGVNSGGTALEFTGDRVVANSSGATLGVSTNKISGSTASPKYISTEYKGFNDLIRARIRAIEQTTTTGISYLLFSASNNVGTLIDILRLDGTNGYVHILETPATDSGTNDILSINASTGAIEKTTRSSLGLQKTATSIASAASITPVVSTAFNEYNVTALIVDGTVNAPTGTPTDGDELTVKIIGSTAVKFITWNAIYVDLGVYGGLPDTTEIGVPIYAMFKYNSSNSKWYLTNSIYTFA